MTDEDVIFDGHALTHERVAGNLAAAADTGVLLNFNERTNLGLIADFATVEIDELRKLDAFSKCDVGCNSNEVVHDQCAPFPDSTARGVASRIFKSVFNDELLA